MRSIAKRPEPAEKADLLLAEPRDIDERLRSAQYCQQTQQQHLAEQISDFAKPKRVWQILEIVQKNNGLVCRPEFHRSPFHRVLRKPNQRIATDSALQPLSRNSSPDCPTSAARSAMKVAGNRVFCRRKLFELPHQQYGSRSVHVALRRYRLAALPPRIIAKRRVKQNDEEAFDCDAALAASAGVA